VKLWELMSQDDVNQLSIPVTLDQNVRFYWADGSQIERTSIVSFSFDKEMQKVQLRFTTYDDEVPDYYTFDPLTVLGYLTLTAEKSLELAEILYQESTQLSGTPEELYLFQEIEETDYTKFGIPKMDVDYDINYHHYMRHLSSGNTLQLLDIGQLTGYISENHDIWISVSNIDSSIELPYKKFDNKSQALIETTATGLQQLADIIKKVAENK
jgi:hypothetical protein